MDRGAWQATVHGVANSRTQVSDKATHTHNQGSNPCPLQGMHGVLTTGPLGSHWGCSFEVSFEI